MSGNEEAMFDASCGIIFSDLFDDLVESSAAKQTDVRKAFDYQIFAYLGSERLDSAIATMPCGMGKARLPCTVCRNLGCYQVIK